eukprot:TRINITY_DN9666_c0_g1_i3.p3 TRINITY_DN9666_c0_g1~~TRINITY_DN9666_c0_g1_i3.p3  ORF type:complete len:128 (+),score=30.18 TRINITY_DN9666_c0_g1_i3:178-561(+)
MCIRDSINAEYMGMDKMAQIKKRIQDRDVREWLQKNVLEGTRLVKKRFNKNKDIAVMRKDYTKEFLDLYKKGFAEYISGNWKKAIEIFGEVKAIREDNPTTALLEYMDYYKNEAPSSWKGFHKFNEK